jgi:FkbM family methyltransferase
MNLILRYLRYFPIDYGKNILKRFVKIPLGEMEYTNKYGSKFHLDLKEYQMRQIYLYDLYEKNTFNHLKKLVKRDHVFVDVGANAGFYSVTVAPFVKEVHSFEPNAVVFERLKRNIELNKLTNIISNQFGLSDKKETLELHYNDDNIGAGSVYGTGGINTQIELKTFDEYYIQHLSKIDIIKVDIEGGEKFFLEGATEAINRNKKLVMIVEMMNDHFLKAGYTSTELFKHIRNLGFDAYLPSPFRLKKILEIPKDYMDNIIFLRGY